MALTKIQWTDFTFNPWIGCTKVSPGCKNCYAETLDENRFSKQAAFGGVKHWGPGAPRHVTSDAYWKQPYAWAARARREGRRFKVFCASLADVYDDAAPDGARERLWDVMRATSDALDWQVLTKRPQNILRMTPLDVLERIWVGTSVEDQERAEERIPILMSVPARVRFLSCEPLLGPVDLFGDWWDWRYTYPYWPSQRAPIDWVIVGGESGADARPFHVDWARGIVKQCRKAKMAPFVKQLGALSGLPLRDKKGGDVDEWPEDLRVREFPDVVA